MNPVRAVRSIIGLSIWLIGAFVSALCAQEPVRTVATAPNDSALVGEGLGGYYFAPKMLVDRIRELETEMNLFAAQGRQSGPDVSKRLAEMRSEVDLVKKQIDDTKTFVATALVEMRSETTSFDLGSEKTLFIIADKVHLIGWDQPHVKVVLEKTVLYTAKETLDDHFAGIKLAHREARAKTEQVGFSAKDIAKSEAEYLASPDGQKLNAEQAAAWKKNFEKIFHSGGIFTDFQNNDIDIVEIAGLKHDQGNRQLLYEVKSPGGGGRMGSVWQRQASVTVYVPMCNRVGVLGGLAGLEVESTRVPLIVRGDGDRDYQSKNWIKDHCGPLTLENVPVESIDNVDGPVSLTATVDLRNSTTSHQIGLRTQSFLDSGAGCTCRNIRGDFTAHILNTALRMSEVSGRLDVCNDFGKTTLIAKVPLAAAAHRIVSQSGDIELQITGAALDKSPSLLALTECGTVEAQEKLANFEDTNFTTWTDGQSVRRGFMGVKKQSGGEHEPFAFRMFDRMGKILQNEDRAPGIDLLSRGGNVRLLAIQQAQFSTALDALLAVKSNEPTGFGSPQSRV